MFCVIFTGAEMAGFSLQERMLDEGGGGWGGG